MCRRYRAARARAKITAGCTDYLTKPVSRLNLIAAAHRHLCHAAGATSDPAAAAPATGPGGATGLRSELAGDPDMRQFLPAYVAMLPERVAAALELMERSDLAALRDVVHQLKGSGGMYGFPQITGVADKAEQRIKEQEPLDRVREAVAELVRLVRSVEGYDRAREREPAGPAEETLQ
jgi:HPt (histidine-containing phosphotransfer) domain-containing protein